ncbi:EF-P 5-aminopentanol modification-associated protein YfmH [Caldicellulosiruptoraceae bacterium PP1]
MERIYDNYLKEEIYIQNYPSGLKAFVIKKPNFSKVFAGYCTHYGSVDSKFIHPETKQLIEVPDGIAHFLEHKLFEEQQGSVFDRFSKFGGMANAFTSFKSTVYYFLASNNFNENFDILLDFVQNPYFTDQNVEKEKGIIAQEIRMYQDDPGWRVYFNLLQALYVKHPVKIDIAGTIESINKITKEDLYTCYNTFYHPSNMIILVCGDVNEKEVFEKIEKSQKITKYQSLIERVLPDEPNYINEKNIEINLSVSSPLFYIGFKDNLNELTPKETINKELTMHILNELLFGKSTKLYNDLYEQGLINQNFAFDYNCENDYSFVIVGGESINPKKTYDVIIDYISKYKQHGINEDDFERSKRVVVGSILRKFDNIEKISVEFINSYFKCVNLFDYAKEIENIKIEDCMKRLNEVYSYNNSAISIINPV